MLVKVLRPFPYAADGIRNVDLAVGEVVPIHDDLVPGLVLEKYVELAAVATPPPVAASSIETLLGSSKLDSILEIAGLKVQLGGLVAASHTESGLTVEAWNELAEDIRDGKLAATLDRLMADPAAAAAELAPTSVIQAADAFDAKSDKELRGFIKERDGVMPHNTVKRPALLELARKVPG